MTDLRNIISDCLSSFLLQLEQVYISIFPTQPLFSSFLSHPTASPLAPSFTDDRKCLSSAALVAVTAVVCVVCGIVYYSLSYCLRVFHVSAESQGVNKQKKIMSPCMTRSHWMSEVEHCSCRKTKLMGISYSRVSYALFREFLSWYSL